MPIPGCQLSACSESQVVTRVILTPMITHIHPSGRKSLIEGKEGGAPRARHSNTGWHRLRAHACLLLARAEAYAAAAVRVGPVLLFAFFC